MGDVDSGPITGGSMRERRGVVVDRGASGGDMGYIWEVMCERSRDRRLALAMRTRGEVSEGLEPRRKGLVVDIGEPCCDARLST